jgi:hypothetical protein
VRPTMASWSRANCWALCLLRLLITATDAIAPARRIICCRRRRQSTYKGCPKTASGRRK